MRLGRTCSTHIRVERNVRRVLVARVERRPGDVIVRNNACPACGIKDRHR